MKCANSQIHLSHLGIFLIQHYWAGNDNGRLPRPGWAPVFPEFHAKYSSGIGDSIPLRRRRHEFPRIKECLLYGVFSSRQGGAAIYYETQHQMIFAIVEIYEAARLVSSFGVSGIDMSSAGQPRAGPGEGGSSSSRGMGYPPCLTTEAAPQAATGSRGAPFPACCPGLVAQLISRWPGIAIIGKGAGTFSSPPPGRRVVCEAKLVRGCGTRGSGGGRRRPGGRGRGC